MSSLLSKIGLTPYSNLLTDVENRSIYNLSQCELNVFETYQQAERVGLAFQDIVITSMIRGKKVMHLPGLPEFDYFPGETVLAPAGTAMAIDFPEAQKDNPTQCIALTLDGGCIHQALSYLNEQFPKTAWGNSWTIDYQQLHLQNNTGLATVLNNLVTVCKEGSTTKDILADLMLKELIVRLAQTQALAKTICLQNVTSHPFECIIQFIKDNLGEKLNVSVLSRKACMSRPSFFRFFKREYGISPAQFIIRERLHRAKELLSQTSFSINHISLESGFEDVNHFIRLFKKDEGITPKIYRNRVVSSIG